MAPEQWNEIVEVFYAAREKMGREQTALLDSACGDNSSLRRAVEQMLRDDKAADDFLDQPPVQSFAAGGISGKALPGAGIAAGQRFGRYELAAPLGHGGMGEVWAARDTELDRLVALKFLVPAAVFGRKRLMREARAASALNHPNIVTVYEVIWDKETPMIVMELVEGTPLCPVSGKPQSLDRVVHVGVQIAQALSAAHAAGIVHRDIKPENILVRADGYIKVLDFGLARHMASGTVTTSAGLPAGTLRYMSPEQARGGSISFDSDIFSFGMVLYELATGRHAFPSDSPFETVHGILTSEPVAPSSVNPLMPPHLDALILAMLAKDQAARPPAAEIARRLGESVLPLPSLRPLAAQRRVLPFAFAGFLILMGGIGWFVFSRSDAPQFTNLRIQPLTSQVGWEAAPALSPYGQSIAFTWTEKLDRPRQIYVKRLTAAEPVKLTNSESEGNIGALVWSPDGKRIAFERQLGDAGAVYTIASTGGEEQKVLELRNPNQSSGIDWSPDGVELAFSDGSPVSEQLAVYLFNLRTGEKRKLTSPPAKAWGDWDPKFSPDGLTVAFKRVTGFWADKIDVVPTTGGTPRQVTAETRGIWGHAWTADGKSLIVSCQKAGSVFGLWRFPMKRQARAERITLGGVDAITPATSRKTSRIAWVNQVEDLNIYRVSIRGGGAPAKVIASALRDQDGAYSRDGRIAFVSDRSGSREIWMAKADASGQVRVTNLNGPPIANLQWSPDGQRLSFDSRLDGHSGVFAIDCESAGLHCGQPKRLISQTSAEAASWSADGKSIYFASDTTRGREVWKQPVDGGPATQVTRHGGSTTHESPDGKWLYFFKPASQSIWRVRTSSSDGHSPSGEQLVIGPPFRVRAEGWTLTPDEIVFIDHAGNGLPTALRAYRIASKRIIFSLTGVFSEREDVKVSVSPDSRWILYSQLDRSGSNVMVAENTL